MWSRPARLLVIVACLTAALAVDRFIELSNLHPGRTFQSMLDFPAGLLVVPVPTGIALDQDVAAPRMLQWVTRSLWFLYVAMAAAIVLAHRRTRIVSLTIAYVLVLSMNMLGIMIVTVIGSM